MANPARTLMRKEIRESVWKFVLAVGLLGVMGAVLGPLYDWLGGFMPQINLDNMPGWIRDPLDLQLRSYVHYLWGNWYSKNLMQFLVILAVVYGAGLIAGETSRGSAGFLFSKPIRRSTVVRVKYIVALGVLWTAALLATVATLLGSSAAGRPVNWAWFLSGLPAALAGTAVILAATELFSVLTRDTAKAIMLAVVAVAVSGLLGVFERLRSLSILYQMSGASVQLTGRIDWVAFGVMLVASAVLVKGAEMLLARRDV